MPSRHPPLARLEFSPDSTEKSPLLTVPTRSPEHGAPTTPASLVPAEPTPPEQPASPTTAPRTGNREHDPAGGKVQNHAVE